MLTGPGHSKLEDEDIESRSKTQGPNAPNGMFTEDHFDVDMVEGTITYPEG
jgi:hypothetical protein